MLTSPPAEAPIPTLREAMRHLAGGVSIVTVGDGSERRGFTATSVTSLTLEPPCVLACVNRQVSAAPTILSLRQFVVNILADRHHGLAARFSGRTGIRGHDRFLEGRWRQAGPGRPLLEDALSAVECRLEDVVERHSHLILIGAVERVHVGDHAAPLIYADGRFGHFEPLR